MNEINEFKPAQGITSPALVTEQCASARRLPKQARQLIGISNCPPETPPRTVRANTMSAAFGTRNGRQQGFDPYLQRFSRRYDPISNSVPFSSPNTPAKNRPVTDCGLLAIISGLPLATSWPPSSAARIILSRVTGRGSSAAENADRSRLRLNQPLSRQTFTSLCVVLFARRNRRLTQLVAS
jgi:hypothetical protein